MGKAHRWFGTVTVAVPSEQVLDGYDNTDMLALPTLFPHELSPVTCFDCGLSADSAETASGCPRPARAGYPATEP